MAHVQWCIGNTTLREAARLKGGKGANLSPSTQQSLCSNSSPSDFHRLRSEPAFPLAEETNGA